MQEHHVLDEMTDDATHQATDDHGRHVDASGDLDPERDGGQDGFDYERDQEVIDHLRRLLHAWAQARAELAILALAGQLQEELRHRKLRVAVPEADHAGEERDEKDVEQRPSLDDRDPSKRPGPEARRLDEHRPESAAEHAQQDEGDHLEEAPVVQISHLEHDNLPGSVGV